ncbi:MAG: 23S rRNA (adenine(2503)-C(2))-methyltransferase RlmN [Firmicutes bacterium]|nr:23S rRNA (adenine(2503)-C(2))-methyltransferase RlmN [Bacillota bacterium]
MNNIYDFTLEELENKLIGEGYKKFNARQIYEWLYKKKVSKFSEMSNLSKALREHLENKYMISTLTVAEHQVSTDGTEKFLFELDDHNFIETVLMRHDYGNSVCVTTQLGCNMGCSFCASGLQKKTRDLQVFEIVQQVLKVELLTNERVSHVVVMGIGEPFDNYVNTMRFIDVINSPYGLEIGARHITVSTCGIIPKIKEFSREEKQVNLAISLHASNDITRSKIMKINNTYSINEVIQAAKDYIALTNRRVTFEYILLEGINDHIKHANELSDLLRGLNCYVNLIRYNYVKEFNLKGSSDDTANSFYLQLQRRGINATLRREKGSDIAAACGQLRSSKL